VTVGLGDGGPGMDKVSTIYADGESGDTVPVRIHRGGPRPTE
jgi:hypothetical protein